MQTACTPRCIIPLPGSLRPDLRETAPPSTSRQARPASHPLRLLRYIQRFRHAPPTSRQRRERLRGSQESSSRDFWWLSAGTARRNEESPQETSEAENVADAIGLLSGTSSSNPWTPGPASCPVDAPTLATTPRDVASRLSLTSSDSSTLCRRQVWCRLNTRTSPMRH